jgi:hypothetical protein
MRTPLGYEEPALARTAARTLRGSVVLGCSSGCWLRVGSGFRSGCHFVVRSRIWLVRRAGSAGLQTGWLHRLPAAAQAWIRHARQCRPCWRRRSGRRSAGCSPGLHERCCLRRRGWGGLGSLRSQRCQRRSPGCRSPRICRQTDGCLHLDGLSRYRPASHPFRRCRASHSPRSGCASRPYQSVRAIRPCYSRSASRPCQRCRASHSRRSRRAIRPCQSRCAVRPY